MKKMLTPKEIIDSRNRLGASFYSAVALNEVPLSTQKIFGKIRNGEGVISRLQRATQNSTTSRWN